MVQQVAYGTHATSPVGPGRRHAVISPSDDDDLPFVPRQIRVNVAATLRIRDVYGTDVDYVLAAGQTIEFEAIRILDTGTSATSVIITE